MEEFKIPVTSAQREAFFTTLYLQTFPAVAKYIAKRSGSADDAKDIFQDSLVIFYENLACGKISPQNAQAYLMGIAKHLWLKKHDTVKQDELTGNMIDVLAENNDEQLSTRRVLNYLEKAGQKCLNLLKAFYYDHVPLHEVAQQFGFSGTRSATVQKYKCLEKVRDTVKQKALHYEDFID